MVFGGFIGLLKSDEGEEQKHEWSGEADNDQQMRRVASAAGFGLCKAGSPELGTVSCASFAPLKGTGCAGLECNTGEWGLAVVWRQVYAASVSVSSWVLRNVHKLNMIFLSPVVFTVRVPSIVNYGLQKL